MNMMSTPTPALALAPLSFSGPNARWRTEAMRSHATGRLIHITKGQGRITVAGLTNGYGPNNLIYISGEPDHKISNEDFIDHLERVIRDKAAALESERAAAEDNIILKTSV